jgi:hypothetical protein
MTYIGIDFSLNSPGVCVQNQNGDYHFISFFNFGNRKWGIKIPKAFSTHEELMNLNLIHGVYYNRDVNDKDFLKRERQKLVDAQKISNLLIDKITDFIDESSVNISLEGFSYGSKGNSFIDIVQYNSFLRYSLVQRYGVSNISIFQPSHVKKLAGKGNANKHYMIKAFQDNVLDDKNLKRSMFWKWIKDKDFSKDIPKPIDDIVDSYFILNASKA